MKEKIIEKKLFILKVNETNKNFRKYPMQIIREWMEKMDDYGYEVEFGINMRSEEIQYDFINSELMCGLVNELSLEDNVLYGKVKFFKDGILPENISSGKINLDECVLVPKGRAEIRDGIVQSNYKLYGFNIVHRSQSSFCM